MADKKAEKVQDDDNITQIYDKIFKRILTLSSVAVIGFINGIFGRNFPKDSKLTYNWTESVKTNLERTIADTIITVNDTEKFHTEIQINNDNTIVLRVFDYGYQDALKYRKTENDRIILEFPQSKIIFLEHNANTPDEVVLELDFKNQGSFEYRVPAMKFLEHSIEDLNKQRLVILLPLYLLKLRREIEKEQSMKNALKLKSLINDGIIKSIEDNEKAGNITHEDTIVLIKLLERLYTHLYGKIKEFKQEGVKDIMTEKLIFDVDIIMHERDKAIHERDKLISDIDKLKHNAEKDKLEIAQNMINDGMTIEQIKKFTNLPLNKIKGLQKQI
ncbi:MAG: hypothetical protein FWH24_03250 [Oscillospiraceae bacterium]|nr:hypothetical protein [Oscillospiraceae bacterium]